VKRNALFQNWRIGESLTTTFNFAALAAYNDAVTVVNPRPQFLDEDEVNNLITARLNAPATTTELGIVEIDTTPVDAARPRAVATNSALLGPATVQDLGRVRIYPAPDSAESPIAVGVNDYASAVNFGLSALSVAPASPTLPVAVGTNDPRVPTQAENNALVGTTGTPSSSNKYVTDADPRLTGIVDINVTSSPYGARGDGVEASGASISSTSATLTVTGAALTLADVTKAIVVPGAGAAGADLVTTIAAFIDATHVTITTPASTTVAAKTVTYGTNDTVAIQAAIDAAAVLASYLASSFPAGGGIGARLYFPKGVYLVTALTFRPSAAYAGDGALYNLYVYGAGELSRIATVSPTADVFTFKGDSLSAYSSNFGRISDLYFYPAVTRTAGWDINIQRAYQFTIDHVRHYNTWGCLKIGDVSALTATEGVDINLMRATTFKYGVKTCQAISVALHDSDLNSFRLDATTLWLDSYTEGCTFGPNLYIANSTYLTPPQTGIALYVTHSVGAFSPPRYNRFIGVFFDSHATAVFAEHGHDFTFEGCFFHATGNGVWLASTNCDGWALDGCTVRGAGATGVLLEAATRFSFIGSKSVGNNVAGAGGVGLVVFAAAAGVRVEGSLFTNAWATGGSQTQGIWIKAGADNFIVTGNDTRGNAISNLLNDAGTSGSQIVANNLT
jgi:hypothetical protein